jgi:hypothetical protein
MKNKIIAVILIFSFIAIITITLLFWLPPTEKELELSPVDNTLYVQSSLPGECLPIITSILDNIESAPSKIPCKVQLRAEK